MCKAGEPAGGLRFIVFTVVLFLGSCGYPEPEPATDDVEKTVVSATAKEITEGQVLAGSYIVSFRSPAGGPRSSYATFAEEYRAHFATLTKYLPDPRIKDIRLFGSVDMFPSTPESSLPKLGSASHLSPWGLSTTGEPASLAEVDFVDDDSARAALREWDKHGDLWFAEPNHVSRLAQMANENTFKKLAETYTALNYWWLNAINLPEAYQAISERDQSATGVPNDALMAENRPIIAVLDSGVDYEHPGLASRIWQNKDLNAANCENDLHGCNTTTARRGKLGNGDVWPFGTSGPGQTCSDLETNCAHGTHVAGLIVGDPTYKDAEGQQPAGTCPVCQIMVLKIVSKVGKDSGILDSSILAAFKYITLFRREGTPAVRVVNASFGKFVRSRAVGLLVRLMRDRTGTLLVAAAGNEDTLTQEYPAAFPDAVAVAAVDSALKKNSFSNFGRWVDISAPGSQLLSTVPGGFLERKSGTSMAAPIVSGVAGLMLARYPNLSFDELRDAIIGGADPTLYSKDFADGYNYTYYYPKIPEEDQRQPLLGSGMLNAEAAINRRPSQSLPIYSPQDRVRRGCAVVGPSAFTASSLLFQLLALPCLLCLLPKAGLSKLGRHAFQSLQLIRAILR